MFIQLKFIPISIDMTNVIPIYKNINADEFFQFIGFVNSCHVVHDRYLTAMSHFMIVM